MNDNERKPQLDHKSVNHLPEIFDREIETKLSNQAHRGYVTKLAACRQFVDRHFRTNYDLPAYPICDVMLAAGVSERGALQVSSISTLLAMPANILDRYLTLAEDRGLISLNKNASDPEVVLTEKGSQDLLLITNAISEVAFTLRPLASTNL